MTTILNEEQMAIVKRALECKLTSTAVQGRDREAVEWRKHLRDILDMVKTGWTSDHFTNIDWVEIYYALDYLRGKEAQDLLDLIGPDGTNMYEGGE